jgi:choline dehydrogenase-like flavoprotein
MSGYFYRLKPVDFRLRSELGPVPGANLVDWPITYEDMSPFYDKAEEQLGVSGEAQPHPFAEPRNKPYPLPPLEEHPIANEVDKACKKLGMHSFRSARGIASREYKGRHGCVYCALCGSYGCEVDAKSGTHVSLLPAALATGNVEIRPECMARSVEVDGQGRAKSVIYRDHKGETFEQPAKLVIVSCTAIESARLLLNSTSSKFPKGLANGNGQVGKNLLFSSFGQSRATFRLEKRKTSWPWLADRAPFVHRSVQDFYMVPASEMQYRKAGTIGFMWTHPNPIHAIYEIATRGKYVDYGKHFKDLMREYRDSKLLEYETYGEWFATPGTYVDIDADTRDKFGLPVARISIDRHPNDLANIKLLMEKGDAVLKAMEPDKFEQKTIAGVTTILQGGTCRMGNDPATSVLDKDCRTHEVPNLYVVDGGFLPTSGAVPLTLTIVANSFRVADALVKKLKREG